jgi:hypothetical protein
MPRKIRLTPFQREVLWLLEEAGEETMQTIRVTLKPLDPGQLDSAITALVSIGFVILGEDNGEVSVILTDIGRLSLTA